MKKLFFGCLYLVVCAAMLTSCEVQTEGLLPTQIAQDTPPDYVMEAIKKEYPNATDLKITVIQPNKFWKVEFLLNGQPYETYIDEFSKFQIGARLAFSDKIVMLKIGELLKKLQSTNPQIGIAKDVFGNNIQSVAISKIFSAEQRALLYYEVLFNNYDGVFLIDTNGNIVKEFIVKLNDATIRIYDLPNLKIYTTKASEQNDFDPFPQSVEQTVKRLGWGWGDFSGISPVLTTKDYPVRVPVIQPWTRNLKLADGQKYYAYNISTGAYTLDVASQLQEGSSLKREYQKFFTENPDRYLLVLNDQGKAMYVVDRMVSLAYLEIVNGGNIFPSDLININGVAQYPILKDLLHYEKTIPIGTNTDLLIGFQTLIYTGINGEYVSIKFIEQKNTKRLYLASVSRTVKETDIPELTMNRLKGKYNDIKIETVRLLTVNDRVRGEGNSLNYSIMEVLFTSNGNNYIGVINDLDGKPYEVIVSAR